MLIYLLLLISIIIILIINFIIKDNYGVSNIENIINVDENNIDNEIDFYTNVNSYRLGDGFYFTEDIGNRWVKHDNDIYGKYNKPLEYIIEKYPNSILADYLIQSNFKQKKYDIIKNIILNKFIKDNLLNPEISCFLHLRVGDKIELDFSNNFLKYLKKQLLYFYKKIDKLKKNNIKNIYIFSGSHVQLESYKYSTIYVNNIINLFKKTNFNVILNFKLHPDKDILKSLNFMHFLGDNAKSQYFKFIIDINKKINPNIIEY